MKIAIIGSTGYTGIAILNEALSRGYDVKVLVRNPDKIPPRDRLEIIKETL